MDAEEFIQLLEKAIEMGKELNELIEENGQILDNLYFNQEIPK